MITINGKAKNNSPKYKAKDNYIFAKGQYWLLEKNNYTATMILTSLKTGKKIITSMG